MIGPDESRAGYDNLDATIAGWEAREKDELIAGLKPISPEIASWALARFAEGFTADAVRRALQVASTLAGR